MVPLDFVVDGDVGDVAMEDAHTMALRLDEDSEESNSFFAVYDGHGGASPSSLCVCPCNPHHDLLLSLFCCCSIGGSTARFAGQNVHRRLVQEDAYKEANYEQALKRAFLGTDEDMLAGESPSLFLVSLS